jgi:hypothetical protein
MDTKRILIGTIVGTVVLYVIGYLIFDMAAASFYAATRAAPDSVYREPSLQWAVALADVPYAVLISLCLANRADATSPAQGLVTGGVIGFLVWATADIGYYGFASVWNVPVLIVDPILEFVHAGLSGAVIAAVLARVPKAAAA